MRAVRVGVAVVALVVAATAGAAPPRGPGAERPPAAPARFFIMGDGTLSVVNAHTDERVTVRYRDQDGHYYDSALRRLDRVFRSGGGGDVTEMSLRLIEVLSQVQRVAGGKSLVLVSGYRSPDYNQALRDQGARAAGGSLHTEGLAADVAFPRKDLFALWKKVRALDCCGAGYYAKEGFLHIDVGRPRFWEPQTSRVEENLSAGNARLFVRTEYDRYRVGEEIVVRLHAMTVPPVRVARTASLVPEHGEPTEVHVEGDAAEVDGCLDVPASGTRLRVAGTTAVRRGKVVLRTCEPRGERTPEVVESNGVDVVAGPREATRVSP